MNCGEGKKNIRKRSPPSIHHLLSLFLFILIYFKKCQGRLHQESKTRWCPQNFSVSLKRSFFSLLIKQISSSFAFILSFIQFSGFCTSQTKRFRLICSYFTHVFEFICYLNSHCVCFTENLLRRRLELNDVLSRISTLKIASTLWPKCGATYSSLYNSYLPSKQNILWAKQFAISTHYVAHNLTPFHSFYSCAEFLLTNRSISLNDT